MICGDVVKAFGVKKKENFDSWFCMSCYLPRGRPSLHTYGRGGFDTRATTSDLMLKYLVLEGHHRGHKSQGSTSVILPAYSIFFPCFLSFPPVRRKASRMPSNTSCGYSEAEVTRELLMVSMGAPLCRCFVTCVCSGVCGE